MAAPIRRRFAVATRAPVLDVVSGAAAIAATVVAVFSIGTWGVLVVLLTAAALDTRVAAVAALAAVALAARLGTSDLAVLAGTQSVLGPGALAGPPVAAVSVWLSAAALVLVSPGRLLAVPFGLSAALLLAGPSGWTVGSLAVRLLAAAASIELALAAPHFMARFGARARALAVGLGAVSVAAAVASRPAGWRWSFDGAALARGLAVATTVAMLAAVPPLLARRRLGASGDA